ncbi:Mobile element protein [Candidatus Enterovibrio escicola]|uniref:Mobile element protein n=1 Tax=Candidatus Enterovibrio escicola TaxID=1927127 RepID=A0A2A5T424_9GAMM|nr:Mobile element protein [Candidatus Enterovibrio escacola]
MPNRGTVTDVVIDTTDLKVYDQGEWKTRKHGKDKWRIWRKLHLAVDVSTY